MHREQVLSEVGLALLIVLLLLATLGMNVPLFRTLLGVALSLLLVGAIGHLIWGRATNKPDSR